jgi:hypothetical protein
MKEEHYKNIFNIVAHDPMSKYTKNYLSDNYELLENNKLKNGNWKIG